jgi:hypothetical protein
MDIYHSTYTQYIDLMSRLKDDVEILVHPSEMDDSTNSILSQIDNTIDTASGETFLPTSELLNITKELVLIKSRMRPKTPHEEVVFKHSFRTLNQAAILLGQITDDCALIEANELSAQEMY